MEVLTLSRSEQNNETLTMDHDKSFGFEIDFLPVGDSSKSGDAICVRWGYGLCTDKPDQFVMVVDGGFKGDGKKILEHISTVYKAKAIDLVVNTHPHADHVGGLHEIIEEKTFAIKCLALHTPWTHPNVDKFFKDGRVTSKSVRENLKDGLESVYELVTKATERKISVSEWFSDGAGFDVKSVRMICLGPSKTYYESLLPSFECTPTNGANNSTKRLECKNRMVKAEDCLLTDDGATSAENNSSLIMSLTLPGGNVILLTGDAGMPALNRAVTRAEELKVDLSELWLFKVPHHGSVQNLGPTTIKDLLLSSMFGSVDDRCAVISVSAKPPFDHPARNLINAITDYGFKVCLTNGGLLQGGRGVFPARGYPIVEAAGPFENVQLFM